MENRELLLPAWAARLREGYLSGEASQFLIHTNVGDLTPWEEGGSLEYVTLMEFLTRFLSRTKNVVVFYNMSEGLRFARPEMKELFLQRLSSHRGARGDPGFSGVIPASPSKVLSLLGEFASIRSNRAAIIIDYLETLVPEGDLSHLSSEDRACLVAVQEWARDPGLMASDNIVVMVSENLMEINRRIRAMPQLMSIEAGLPDSSEREKFIRHAAPRYKVKSPEPRLLAEMTAGLSRIQIEGIFKHAAESGTEVALERVAARKKGLIERECMGLVEVVEPRHGFESVGGVEGVKEALCEIAGAVRDGNARRVPMGILLVGPMGTGKSFVAEAFAKESGLTCIKLKSFREKWVGATEANLERILSIIEALGSVVVIIDEADRNLARGVSQGDSGTESRVMARLKEFMADTGHRGKILFMVLTNRPDRLDVDMKRPGRLDLKIPVFYPESAEQREKILSALCKKHGLDMERNALEEAARQTAGFSGADLEGLLMAADRLASREAACSIGTGHMEAALSDFIPSRDRESIEYMELLAAFEASSRSMLPEKYRGMGSERLQEMLRSKRKSCVF